MLFYACGPPVPAGVYGVAILEVEAEAQVHDFISKDTAATINRYEVFPMMAKTSPFLIFAR